MPTLRGSQAWRELSRGGAHRFSAVNATFRKAVARLVTTGGQARKADWRTR
jgi:hypothetical protein